jgi:hypothetical protein
MRLTDDELEDALAYYSGGDKTYVERVAFNYLVDALGGLMPETLEGDRLYGLCLGILREAKERNMVLQ